MQKEIIRVVVASPSDVQEERDSMPHIIENLNREIADLFKLRLECYMWETVHVPVFIQGALKV